MVLLFSQTYNDPAEIKIKFVDYLSIAVKVNMENHLVVDLLILMKDVKVNRLIKAIKAISCKGKCSIRKFSKSRSKGFPVEIA